MWPKMVFDVMGSTQAGKVYIPSDRCSLDRYLSNTSHLSASVKVWGVNHVRRDGPVFMQSVI